jgi:COMPASS component SWD3
MILKLSTRSLLAEARNNTPADLQLHGLRPPEPHSSTYMGLNTQPTSSYASPSSTTLPVSHASTQSAILQWQDGNLRDDMLRLIDQFLEEEGMGATRQTLAEEWTGKARERGEAEADARKLRKAILGEECRALSWQILS